MITGLFWTRRTVRTVRTVRTGFLVAIVACGLALGACAPKKGQDPPHQDAHADPHGDAHGDEHGDPHADTHGDEHQDGAVTMPEKAQARAGVRVAAARVQEVDLSLTTTGEVAIHPDREAHVSGRVSGRVVGIHKRLGDHVRRGEALATLESLDLGEAQAAYLEAEARHDLARKTLERQESLQRDQITAQKELQVARNQVRLAEIDLEKARNRLELHGLGEARIATLARKRKIDPTLPLTAPIDGVVVARHVTLGERLDPAALEPAFTIWDTSEVWVEATLYERDLAKVLQGQSAAIGVAALGGRSYAGRVHLISTTLDRETRTAKARIAVGNSDRRLKPGMFVTVRIAVGRQKALAIPQSAVMRDKDDVYVFVREAADRFEKRPIGIAEKVGDRALVGSGLKAGDPVVVAGAFVLKSELLKEQFGEHDH